MLARAAASAFASSAGRAVAERNRFTVALAGGGTPLALYRALATEHRDSIPWQDVHLFWSDERFVPQESPDSNFAAAREALVAAVPVPSANVHPAPTALPDPEQAAARYEAEIRAFFEPDAPRFDWMLLGLGEDGHVASLFPGSAALVNPEKRLVVAVRTEAKPPPLRLTMTLELIGLAREIHVLVTGKHKREILERIRGGEADLPGARLPDAAVFWADRDAAGDSD